MLIPTITFIAIIVLVLLMLISFYNRLVKLRNNRENAFADIDVQLKQRHDLIPQLVDTVKGYMNHEEKVLTNITAARAGALNASTINEKISAENQLSTALSGLNIAVEAYPDLKASSNFTQLQEEISDVENKLSAVRRFFNSATKEYNNAVETFPSNIIAGMFSFKKESMFDVGALEREALDKAPTVSFYSMKYIGLQSQISSNNRKSILLLIAFPLILLGLVWLFFFAINIYLNDEIVSFNIDTVHSGFLYSVPYVTIGVVIWFLIAWFSHSSMIQRATGSKPLERKENKRVYNLTENLCISRGMKMPKIFIIEDDSLNAFASGLSDKTFAVSLSRGIINKLEDDELEAVIAHELTHIINRDVRLLIVSIIFVGIFTFITEMAFRSLRFAGRGRGKKEGGAIVIVLIVVVLGIIGMILSSFFRFTLSRKREYLADAGAAEMTKNPLALASALKKISKDPWIEAVKRDDVAQMFIDHPTKKKDRKSLSTFFNGIFATHPPIKERIQVLEQF